MEGYIHLSLPPLDLLICGVRRSTIEEQLISVPYNSPKSRGVVSISVNRHIAYVTTDGEVFTWGPGSDGKLGNGDERGQSTPKRIEALVGMKVK